MSWDEHGWDDESGGDGESDEDLTPATDRRESDELSGPDGQQDPIQERLGDEEDLYDVATWDVRSPLDQFAVQLAETLRLTRRWLLVGVAAVLFLAQLAVAGFLVVQEPVLGVFGLLSVVPALGLAAYFWFEDPTRREPVLVMAVTFLLSVLLASIAAIVNTALGPFFELIPLVGLPLFFFLVVGPIEETVKWASIRLYAYRDERFDAVIDGVVYGAIAGLGFAAIENFTYIANMYFAAESSSTLQPLQAAQQTAYTRALVGPGHVIYSAFAGYYLGLAKFNPDNRGEIVVKGLVIAVFVHATYNTLVSFLPLTSLTLIAFLVVYDGFWFLVLYRKVSRYKTYYRQAKSAAVAGRQTYEDEVW